MASSRPLALKSRTFISVFKHQTTSLALLRAPSFRPHELSRQVCYTFPLKTARQGIEPNWTKIFSSLIRSIGVRSDPIKSSVITKTLSYVAIACFFATAGFVVGAIPAFQAANEILDPPTNKDTLTMYIPEDDTSRKVEEYINNHPLTKELRSRHEFSESRPHLKIPRSQLGHSLTGGTLLGPGRVIVPPFAWTEKGGKSLVAISYLGSDLCGHPGIIHGGFLATMLDEGIGLCCFDALPNKIGMTANLNINYRAPVPAGSFVVMRAWTTKVKGRKAWVKAQIETLPSGTEKPIVFAEASSLYIEPRQAAVVHPDVLTVNATTNIV